MRRLFTMTLFAAFFAGTAHAVEVRTYYLPTCPFCTHAKEFISGDLIAQFPHIQIVNVDLANRRNHPQFMASMEMCGVSGGGVPLIIVGGTECVVGFGADTPNQLRDLVELAPRTTAAVPSADAQKKNLPTGRNFIFLMALLGIGLLAFGAVALTKRKE